MASLIRLSSAHQKCTRHTIFRYYSDTPFQRATNKWQLAGVPRPRSILEDDDAVIDLSEDNDAVNGANPNTPPLHLRRPPEKPTPHEYKAHRQKMRKEFPEGWAPPRKLSREAMESIRQLNRLQPQTFSTAILADKFKVSPEAIRRILKSRWEPSAEERTRLAIRERKQREAYLQSKRQKEQAETETVGEIQRMLRRDRYIRQKGNSGSEDEQRTTDTFTFR